MLAISIFCQAVRFSGIDVSGTVRLCRQAAQNISGESASISQLHTLNCALSKTVELVLERKRRQLSPSRLQCGKRLRLRNIAEAMIAFFAFVIFKIEKL